MQRASSICIHDKQFRQGREGTILLIPRAPDGCAYPPSVAYSSETKAEGKTQESQHSSLQQRMQASDSSGVASVTAENLVSKITRKCCQSCDLQQDGESFRGTYVKAKATTAWVDPPSSWVQQTFPLPNPIQNNNRWRVTYRSLINLESI